MNLLDYIGKQMRTQPGITNKQGGEWIDITGIGKEDDNLTFLVTFNDGMSDSFIIGDPDDYYEFRDKPVLDPITPKVQEFLNRNGQGFMSNADVAALINLIRTGSEA